MKKKIVPWDLVCFGGDYQKEPFVYVGLDNKGVTVFSKVDGSATLHAADPNNCERIGVSLAGLEVMKLDLLSCLVSFEPKSSKEKEIITVVTKRITKVFG